MCKQAAICVRRDCSWDQISALSLLSKITMVNPNTKLRVMQKLKHVYITTISLKRNTITSIALSTSFALNKEILSQWKSNS